MEHPIEAHQDAQDVETLMQQLRDPATLLANALGRIHEADAAAINLIGADLALYQVAAGQVLTQIAKTAADLAEQERRHTMTAIDDFLDDPVGQGHPAPADGYEPKAVNGVRFTADLRGSRMGVVAGREWLYAHEHGFIDISEADEVDGPEGAAPYRLTGRVVSATPDHALCVTDGGVSVTLPRALIVESPDE